MKVNTNVSNKTRRELVLDDFKGVDFSSSPLKVSGSRASFASNLICDNGVNHKRPGWESMLDISEKLDFSVPIDGIYYYQNGTHQIVIIYSGGFFWGAYPYKAIGSTDNSIRVGNHSCSKLLEADFTPGKVQFFSHKDRLYIIGCGAYLVYGTWDNGKKYELKRVISTDDIYVPITTGFAKPAIVYDYDEDGTDRAAEAGVILEKVNILSSKRANTFIGDVGTSDCECRYYTDVPFAKNDFCYLEYEKSAGETETGNLIMSTTRITDDEMGPYSEHLFDYIMDEDNTYCIGVSSRADLHPDGDKQYANVKIVFNKSSITAELSAIEKCTFGTMFGAYGNSDRLFLSGNPDMPNADFYSGFDNFTYFTADSQTVMGSSDVPITGYLRLSDSTLATLKAETNTEPTIYYRTAAEKEIELENGQKTSEVIFTRWTGGINEGCVNPYCTALFADDNLMLSPNGVRGIVQISNSATNERYVRERDKFINSDLVKRDLSNAVAIVYKNRYYLAVDGVCYVADPRYTTYVKDDIDGSFNYEWWFWENIPSRVFAIVNGELWFGTSDGKVCKFCNQFEDREMKVVASSDGDFSIVYADAYLDASYELWLDESWYEAVFSGDYFLCQYLTGFGLNSDKSITVLKANDNVILKVGDVVQIDSEEDLGDLINQLCTVSNIEYVGNYIHIWLKDFSGNIVTKTQNSTKPFNIYRVINDQKIFIKANKYDKDGDDITDGYKIYLYDKKNGNVLYPVQHSKVEFETTHYLSIYQPKNVVSRWFSPVFDLGAFDVSKTLLSMSITVDPSVRGKVQFGYDTRDCERYISSRGDAVLDFDALNFEEFSFDTTGFATSHTVKSKLRNFNYIMFKLISDNDKDCAVCNLKAVYQYNGRLKGVQ